MWIFSGLVGVILLLIIVAMGFYIYKLSEPWREVKKKQENDLWGRQKDGVKFLVDKYTRITPESILYEWHTEPLPSPPKLKDVETMLRELLGEKEIGYDRRREEYISNRLRTLYFG